MKVGTATPIKEEKRKLKKRPNFSRLSGMGNNNGNNDNGGGGDDGGDYKPKKINSENTNPEPTNKSKILMWFLLGVVLMTFSGLIGAYVVIATNNALEWKPFALPFQVWISTIIILASSITYHIAKTSLHKERDEKAKKWFLVTTVLGGVFISSQIMAWLALVNRGLYMHGNPFAGFFYILTAVHAVHVLGGIFALGYIILRTWNRTISEREVEKRKNDATAIGWYWHTMDGLWLILLFLLGFWV
ncbi:MAG: cytochrome c oxidase subunit 3 [Aridibacter sp.]